MRMSGGLKLLALTLGLTGIFAGCENSPDSQPDKWIRPDGQVWYPQDRAPAPGPAAPPTR